MTEELQWTDLGDEYEDIHAKIGDIVLIKCQCDDCKINQNPMVAKARLVWHGDRVQLLQLGPYIELNLLEDRPEGWDVPLLESLFCEYHDDDNSYFLRTKAEIVRAAINEL